MMSFHFFRLIIWKRTDCTPLFIVKQLRRRPARSFFDNISSCSRWNRTGETVASELPEMHSITIGNDEKLYIVNNSTGKYRVQVYTSGSKFGRILKEGINVVVHIDEDGTIYTASYDGGYIEVWTIDNNESMIIDCFCKQCHRIWINRNNEDIYMIESSRHRIVKCNSYTSETVTVAGMTDASELSNGLDYPYDIYITEKEDIYVADVNNSRIQKWEKDAKLGSTVAGKTKKSGTDKNLFNEPHAVMVDEKNKFIYVVDMHNHRIMRWIEGAAHDRVIVGIPGKLTDYSIILNETLVI
jgi:6-phosphogluconolactonase (cycloisomerase 2 family)